LSHLRRRAPGAPRRIPLPPRRDAPRLIAYLQIGNTKMCGIARAGREETGRKMERERP